MLAEGKKLANSQTKEFSKSGHIFSTRILAEIVVFVAMAGALAFVSHLFFELPQGGTINIGMVPIFWLALRRGPKIGIFAGAVLGVVDLFIEPFVVNPIQFILDYPLAFACLGLAGFFRSSTQKVIPANSDAAAPALKTPKGPHISYVGIVFIFATILVGVSFVSLTIFSGAFLQGTWFFASQQATYNSIFNSLLFIGFILVLVWGVSRLLSPPFISHVVGPVMGVVAGGTGRFISHFVSGVVYFSSYAPPGLSPVVYSILYNGSYMVPSVIICAIVIALLQKSKTIDIYD